MFFNNKLEKYIWNYGKNFPRYSFQDIPFQASEKSKLMKSGTKKQCENKIRRILKLGKMTPVDFKYKRISSTTPIRIHFTDTHHNYKDIYEYYIFEVIVDRRKTGLYALTQSIKEAIEMDGQLKLVMNIIT